MTKRKNPSKRSTRKRVSKALTKYVRAANGVKKNPAKTISLRNFTGKVRLNADKTVSVLGTGKRGAKRGKR
jgi:hypothetical protein